MSTMDEQQPGRPSRGYKKSERDDQKERTSSITDSPGRRQPEQPAEREQGYETQQEDWQDDIRRTKVHGFKKPIISNFLKDRHPYLHSRFAQRYDPKEVFHAVFDRSIPKLVEILAMDDLPSQSYKEAFMLLNEMVSHQENKMTMIESDLVPTSLAFMRHPEAEVRREAVCLLGSLLSVKKGRDQLIESNCPIDPIVPEMLMKDGLKCREVCGWMLCRMCSGRDGCMILINQELVQYIIASFRKYSENFDANESMFLIYLLECMASILQLEKGIEQLVSTAAMKRFNEILLRSDTRFGEYETRIRYLCLECTSLICMNDDGKEESIGLEMINTANKYLNDSEPEVVNAATRVIMFSAIHLEGKNHATSPADDEIIKNLIGLLKHESKDIVRNAEIAITCIADLPKGFKIICKYLSLHLSNLDAIFGPMAIVPLYSLLFKIDRPPFVTEDNEDSALRYALAICYFINSNQHKEEALDFATEKTCKIVDRLVPLMLVKENREAQIQIAQAVEAICVEDEVNRLSFQSFVSKNGEIKNERHQTTLLAELARFSALYDLFKMREDENQGEAKKGSSTRLEGDRSPKA